MFILLLTTCLCFPIKPMFPHKNRRMNQTSLDFETWAMQNEKIYSRIEFLRRKAIFENNKAFVQNANLPYEVGIEGPFSDLTVEEFNSRLTHLVSDEEVEYETLPDEPKVGAVDWRSRLPAIRNQGSCGSCWAFGAVGVVEGRLTTSGGAPTSIDLSEQQLVDCDTSRSRGCNGGYTVYAIDYICSRGVQAEADYRYTAANGTCKYNSSLVRGRCTGRTNVSRTESAIATAVDAGPVSASMDASGSGFQSYRSGIYYSDTCSKTSTNHAVVIVGWGTSGSTNYWWVRNSWGTSWGQAGYFQLRRGTNECNISSNCSYATGLSYR